MPEIIDRITKLLSLAFSPNEFEASAAMAKAQEILTEHNLRLEDIKTSHKSPDIPIEQTEILSGSRKVYWRGFIANAIANANFCKAWWMGGKMVVAGRAYNIAIALSLYDYLTKTVERLAVEGVKAEKQAWHSYLSQQVEGTGSEAFIQPNWRRWKSSFITGCCQRLLERIEAQTRRMNGEGIPNTKVTGLACRMAHEREQEAMPSTAGAAIALWRREQGITLTRRRATSRARVTSDGYTVGQHAGGSISLERQLSSTNGKLLH